MDQIVAEESAEVAERHKARTAASATDDHIYEVREWDPSSGEIKEVGPLTIHVVALVRQGSCTRANTRTLTHARTRMR